jgi:fructuronate reductase
MTSATVQSSVDRAPVRIAHLGVGAFHRAHQAWYTEAANRETALVGGAQWGIAAFTGRSPDAAVALAAQECRYDLVVRGPEHDAVERIESIVEAHDGGDADEWRRVMCGVDILTLTITERGYTTDEARSDHDVAALTKGVLPSSPLGRIVDGLRARRSAGGGSLAIVSCDNLDSNGELVRDRVQELALAVDPALSEWIAENVSFVSTMVDRITPAVVDALPIEVTDDPCAIVTEPDTIWVLAGDFPAGRPKWESAGARFVDDIAPFEKRKLWLLNAGHTLLASLGQLRGHESVSEAMTDPVCRRALDDLWDDAASVMPFTAKETAAERALIASRFANPRIRHTLAQIAKDSEVKLRVRVVPVIEERRRRGWSGGHGALLAVAAWAEAVSAGLAEGPAFPDDPTQAALSALHEVSPALAEDEDIRAQLIAVAHEWRGSRV